MRENTTCSLAPLTSDSPLPRYRQIKDIICDKINKKEWNPGDTIPSENELAKTFQVSNNTVVRAIIDLKNMGILYRIQGKGTFVAHPSGRLITNRSVGLLVRTRGHLFGPLSQYLIQNLQKNNYYPAVLDPTLYSDLENEIEQLDSFLKSQPAGVIIDCGVEWGINLPLAWLQSKAPVIKNLIFVNRFEDEARVYDNAYFALSDYRYGGYLAIRHFLELGHKKIAVLTYSHSSIAETPPKIPKNVVHRELLVGCKDAMREKGLDPETNLEIVFDTVAGQERPEYLEHSLTSPDRPTAIFAFGDGRAKRVFQIAKRLNLKIPKDLAMLGYFNTPWVEMLDIPLSSISIEEEEIAKAAVEILIQVSGGNVKLTEDKRKIYIKPKLIVRDSCGARPGSLD